MWLKRWLLKCCSLLFPKVVRRRKPGHNLLTSHQRPILLGKEQVQTVFSPLRVSGDGVGGKWVVHARSRADVCRMFQLFPAAGHAATEWTAKGLLTKVRIDRHTSMALLEYLSPPRSRLLPAGGVERCFARAVIEQRGCTCGIIDFYIDKNFFRTPPQTRRNWCR